MNGIESKATKSDSAGSIRNKSIRKRPRLSKDAFIMEMFAGARQSQAAAKF